MPAICLPCRGQCCQRTAWVTGVRHEAPTQRPSSSRAPGGSWLLAAAAPARKRAGQHTAAATRPLSNAPERKRLVARARRARARAGAGGAARVPQLHRHGLLPAPAPVPARAAAAPERALQGARGRAAGARRSPCLWEPPTPDAFTGLRASAHMLMDALPPVAASGLHVRAPQPLCSHVSPQALGVPSGTDWTFADGGRRLALTGGHVMQPL